MTPPVTIRTYPVRSDAEIALARLAADGIRAAVRADDEGGLNPGFYRRYGVRLEVEEADVDDALASLGIERLELPRALAHAITTHAVACFPEEACGLLLFAGASPVFACCLTNREHSAHRFTIDPEEHHGALRFAQRRGWRIGGVFHSHPGTEAFPSPHDVAEGGDPDWYHLIAGPVRGRGGALRAFRIRDGDVTEVSLAVEA